jgi:hypothetical protein
MRYTYIPDVDEIPEAPIETSEPVEEPAPIL